jgi:hypothetical protein
MYIKRPFHISGRVFLVILNCKYLKAELKEKEEGNFFPYPLIFI